MKSLYYGEVLEYIEYYLDIYVLMLYFEYTLEAEVEVNVRS
jgi:hypothetical protein